MWVMKRARFWSKKRRRRNKRMDGGLSSSANCPSYNNSYSTARSQVNQPPLASSVPECISKFQPNAPPLPPGAEYDEDLDGSSEHGHESLIQGGGYEIESGSGANHGSLVYEPMAYGQSSSYQQYMVPASAYGVPIWLEMEPEWSTGLCHCEADMMPTCLLGFFCPCILFGKIAERLDGGITSCLTASVVWYILQQVTCLGCIYSSGFRRKLRARYSLPEKPLSDCLVHYFCWPCAFCQEYREMNLRRIREEALTSRLMMAAPQQQSMIY